MDVSDGYEKNCLSANDVPQNLYSKTHQNKNLKVFPVVLQLSLPNPLTPDVKSRMKIDLINKFIAY